MLFKRYYCADCGTKLKTEKTHRIVTKDDPDYYRYHDVGQFPRVDYDVYDYRFRCPSCGKRTTYDEQRVISKMQKKQGSHLLSPYERNKDRDGTKSANSRQVLLHKILFFLFFSIVGLFLYLYLNPDLTAQKRFGSIAFILIVTMGGIVNVIGKHKGIFQSKFLGSYSYEKKTQLERLHTYCTHNKSLVEKSTICYCFYCKSTVDARDIDEFIDSEQTALCPKCGIDAIIPDSIDEPIDETIISEMHAYWF